MEKRKFHISKNWYKWAKWWRYSGKNKYSIAQKYFKYFTGYVNHFIDVIGFFINFSKTSILNTFSKSKLISQKIKLKLISWWRFLENCNIHFGYRCIQYSTFILNWWSTSANWNTQQKKNQSSGHKGIPGGWITWKLPSSSSYLQCFCW